MTFNFRTHVIPTYRLSILPALSSVVGIFLLISWGIVMLVSLLVLLNMLYSGYYDANSVMSLISFQIITTIACWFVFRKWAHVVYIERLLKRRRWITQPTADAEVPPDKVLTVLSIIDALAETDRQQLEVKRHAFLIDETMIDGKKPRLPTRQSARGAVYALYDVVFAHSGWRHDDRLSGDIVAHYTVFSAKLRRQAPYLVFDSHLLRGRWLTSIYPGSRKLSLDNHLESYFTTYSSEYYQIEALSFITPEVIEAMIGLEDCDIEFVGDSLFCYTTLLQADDLADFRRRCLELYSKVGDNLRFYRGKPKKPVPLVRRIFKNPLRHLPAAVLYGVASICLFAIETTLRTQNTLLFMLILAAGILAANEFRKMIITGNYNRRVALQSQKSAG